MSKSQNTVEKIKHKLRNKTWSLGQKVKQVKRETKSVVQTVTIYKGAH